MCRHAAMGWHLVTGHSCWVQWTNIINRCAYISHDTHKSIYIYIHMTFRPPLRLKFSPNSLLWGSLLEKAGRDMLWPCLRSLSAMCPPRVCLVCALCPPGVRFGPASKPCLPFVLRMSALCPPCDRLVSATFPPCVHFAHASKPCAPPLVSGLWSTMCPPCVLFVSSGPPCVLASGLCPLVARCGAGPWHHEAEFFLHGATCRVYIAWISFLGIHFGSYCRRSEALHGGSALRDSPEERASLGEALWDASSVSFCFTKGRRRRGWTQER